MNEQFTSGPWHAVQTDSQMSSEGTTVVCLNRPGKDKYYVFADQVHHGDVAADAALIASAPNLLEVLEQVANTLSTLTDNPISAGLMFKIHSAIDKARTI